MIVIEKMEIKSFRSFGNFKGNKTQVVKIGDVNIFSGANDSGKSNILRALNLFFNQNTDINEFINFETDFFKNTKPIISKDVVKEEQITIKLSFWNKKNKDLNARNKDAARLPERFWVARKWLKTSTYTAYNQADGVKIAFKTEKKKNWKEFFEENGKTLKSNISANLYKQLTDFLNSIQFHYVPAIKDKTYFSHLYGELQQTLLKEENSDVNKDKVIFEKTIQKSTEELMQEFKNVVNNHELNMTAFFELPDLINLFKTLNVQTGNVKLQFRGDGIQAKLIPEILYFIAIKELAIRTKNLKKGQKSKKYFIWGFEEPENSYEYKNSQLLANRFYKLFSKSSQIFITTHSKEFLSIKRTYTEKEHDIINSKLSKREKEKRISNLSFENKSSIVSIYRVWKNENTFNSSHVARYDEKSDTWDKLCDDIGLIQESRIIEDLQARLCEQNKLLDNSSLTLEQQLKIKNELILEMNKCISNLNNADEKIEEYEKPILYIEDKYDQIYKIAYLKVKNIVFSKNDFIDKFKENSPFVIRRAEGADKLAGRLRVANNDGYESMKIVGLFDFDTKGREQFHYLCRERCWSNELNGTKETGIYRKRIDHECFFALLIPIPLRLNNFASMEWDNFLSYIEIENLLPENFLLANNLVDEQTIPGNLVSLKTKKDKKQSIWKKLFDLPYEDFNDFKPLFDKLEELFGLCE